MIKKKSLLFQWMISSQIRSEGTFSCTHIYLTYISLSTHPPVTFGKKRKDISAKCVLVEAWLQLFFFPFSALYGVCQTQWTWKRKKVWLPPKPLPPPMFFKVLIKSLKMQKFTYSEDWISKGAAYAYACGLFFFFLPPELILSSAVGLFCHSCLFVQKGPFFPSTYNEGEQTNR